MGQAARRWILLGLGGKVGQIDWGTTPEQQLATLKAHVTKMDGDLYDNGTPGFIPRVEKFMSEYNGASKEQERMHEQNSRKLNVLLVLATVIAAIATALGVVVTSELSHKGELDPAKIFHSLSQPEVAHNQTAKEE